MYLHECRYVTTTIGLVLIDAIKRRKVCVDSFHDEINLLVGVSQRRLDYGKDDEVRLVPIPLGLVRLPVCSVLEIGLSYSRILSSSGYGRSV